MSAVDVTSAILSAVSVLKNADSGIDKQEALQSIGSICAVQSNLEIVLPIISSIAQDLALAMIHTEGIHQAECCRVLQALTSSRPTCHALTTSPDGDPLVQAILFVLGNNADSEAFKSELAANPDHVDSIMVTREVSALAVIASLLAGADAAVVAAASQFLSAVSFSKRMIAHMCCRDLVLAAVGAAVRLPGHVRHHVCTLLWNASVDENYRKELIEPALGVIPMLHLSLDDKIAASSALGALRNLSFQATATAQMESDNFLRSLLHAMTPAETLSNRIIATEILFRIYRDSEMHIHMASAELGLFQAMLSSASCTDPELQTSACLFLWNILTGDLLRAQLCTAVSGLVPVLVDVVKTGCKEAKHNALGALNMLSLQFSTMKYLSKPSLGVVSAAITAIEQNDDAFSHTALNLLRNMCSSSETRGSLEIHVPVIIPLMAVCIDRSLGDADDSNLLRSVAVLSYLCETREARLLVCSAGVALLPALLDMLQKGQSRVRHYCISIFKALSIDEKARPVITSKEASLVQVIIGEIKQRIYDGADLDNGMTDILWNCSLPGGSDNYYQQVTFSLLNQIMQLANVQSTSCVLAILRNGVGIYLNTFPNLSNCNDFVQTIKYLVNFVNDDKDAIRTNSLAVLWNMAEMGNDDCTQVLLEQNAHVAAINVIHEAGPDRSFWKDITVSWAINFLMNIAYHDNAVKELTRMKTVDLMLPILMIPKNDCECVKAMFILAFLVGKDDIESSITLLRTRPETIESLIVVLQDTLDRKFDNFEQGTFCLKLIVKAALTLSISDENKKCLITSTPLLYLLRRVIEMFVNNEPEIENVGGGGDDLEAVSVAVKTLLHLSFYYQDTVDLCSNFNRPGMEFVGLLDMLVVAEVPAPTKTCARQMRQRLEEPVVFPSALRSGSNPAVKKHVMLSYCWHDSANPRIVKQLAHELGQRGVEVWRDEVGSSLVPRMSGSVDDSMAQAVQCSDTVIICVSPKYKESINCQLEANYASHLVNKGLLKLCFVVMDNKYTPQTTPHCDGWLGLMIGRNLWYPLWSESVVATTADSIVQCIGSGAKRDVSINLFSSASALSSLAPPDTPTTLSEAAVVVGSLATGSAWDILLNPNKVSNQKGLDDLFNELGISCAEELELCDSDELERIAQYLKPIPRRLFLKHLSRT